MTNPIEPFLEHQAAVVLDAGLATQLEAAGADLSGELWSAELLGREPERIAAVHRIDLEAGADVITAATYQATLEGFASHRGVGRGAARRLFQSAVEIARSTRDDFWREPANRLGRLRPLVAASVGPYGAFLADGSEYRGDYHRDGVPLDAGALDAFHRERFELLARSGADLLACETIPSHLEAQALARRIRETSDVGAWISFTCRDGRHISDGTPLTEVVAKITEIAGGKGLVAVGVNCLAPGFVAEAIAEIRRATDLLIVVYPNSGEGWDAEHHAWTPGEPSTDLAELAAAWVAAGARLVGGCCRTSSEDVRRIRQRLRGLGGGSQ